MYVLPLIAIFVIALAIFFSPILAILILVLFLFGLGFYKYLGRGTDPEHAPPAVAGQPAGRASAADGAEQEGGIWGETWPEERSEN